MMKSHGGANELWHAQIVVLIDTLPPRHPMERMNDMFDRSHAACWSFLIKMPKLLCVLHLVLW